ncbi:MAG: GTP-binding protein [Promethearchaeota archaeon]
MIKLKIIVAGAKNVGKTSLIRRYVSGKFDINTLSTIGVDFMTKNLTVNNQDVHLSIWDFAGESKFRSLFPGYLSGASGALILYDITSRSSFDELDEWMNLIDSASGKISKLLIAAKSDLGDQKQVNEEEGKNFQSSNKIDHFLECSSKTGQNVEKIFSVLTESILKSSLKKCPHCGETIAKELFFCTYCGKKLV